MSASTRAALRSPQARLTDRYREARASWMSNPSVRRIAGELGLTERVYCDRYVRQNFAPLTWTDSTINPLVLDADRAFLEAL